MTKVDLPTILRFDGVHDSGEFGSASCPHCGADGRYVYSFLTTDGPRGAMSGCIKLFPVSPVAEEHKKILDKGKDGGKLNGWDTKKLDAIEALYRGEKSEDDAMAVIRYQNATRNAWVKKRYGR